MPRTVSVLIPCLNPWNGSLCLNTDIEVYILYKDERLPICRRCWKEIGESSLEWTNTKEKEK